MLHVHARWMRSTQHQHQLLIWVHCWYHPANCYPYINSCPTPQGGDAFQKGAAAFGAALLLASPFAGKLISSILLCVASISGLWPVIDSQCRTGVHRSSKHFRDALPLKSEVLVQGPRLQDPATLSSQSQARVPTNQLTPTSSRSTPALLASR